VSRLRDALDGLAQGGLRAVVLEGGERDEAAGGRPLEVLVAPADYRRAVAVMDAATWRYAWPRAGLLRALPGSSYWWDGGTDVAVSWAVSAAPLPWAAMRGLTRALWASATPSGRYPNLLEPSADALVVYLAVQSCRPLPQREDWARFLATCSTLSDFAPARTIAQRAGVGRALDRALAARAADAARPGRGAILDGLRGQVGDLGLAVHARLRPRRWRRLLAGAPRLGDAPIRCRIGGAEAVAPPGVFVPTPDAELFVEGGLRFLGDKPAPRVVDVGSGCGAIALAIAVARRDADVHGTELDRVAVLAARTNAQRLGARVAFHAGSVLEPLPARLEGSVDLILANLPFYPPMSYAPIGSVPRDTIAGQGGDGLGLVRQLVRSATVFLRPGGRLMVQMFATQWELFRRELEAQGYRTHHGTITGPFVVAAADWAGTISGWDDGASVAGLAR